jgi:hypothetical protein
VTLQGVSVVTCTEIPEAREEGDDEVEVRNFITQFNDIDDVFIRRGLGLDVESDIINSTDADYVMRRIRERYLHGSSVTIVMVGQCTWARRYVDWEIQASLRRGTGILPNGLIGIILPSGVGATVPPRLQVNRRRDSSNNPAGYARLYDYPTSAWDLSGMIREAHDRRLLHNSYLIENPRERPHYNAPCP